MWSLGGVSLADLLGRELVELLHRDQVHLLVLRLELLALGHLGVINEYDLFYNVSVDLKVLEPTMRKKCNIATWSWEHYQI